jgi:hypothetical protein
MELTTETRGKGQKNVLIAECATQQSHLLNLTPSLSMNHPVGETLSLWVKKQGWTEVAW